MAAPTRGRALPRCWGETVGRSHSDVGGCRGDGRALARDTGSDRKSPGRGTSGTGDEPKDWWCAWRGRAASPLGNAPALG
eukprot:814314-Prymnesium_polylepis.1